MLKIFTQKRKKPDDASLKEQVFSVITTYVAIQGLHSLLRPEMATVMLKGFEAFLTQDPARIENPESIMAVVSLKDMSHTTNSEKSSSPNPLAGVSSVRQP
jgi:hypothetical protein